MCRARCAASASSDSHSAKRHIPSRRSPTSTTPPTRGCSCPSAISPAARRRTKAAGIWTSRKRRQVCTISISIARITRFASTTRRSSVRYRRGKTDCLWQFARESAWLHPRADIDKRGCPSGFRTQDVIFCRHRNAGITVSMRSTFLASLFVSIIVVIAVGAPERPPERRAYRFGALVDGRGHTIRDAVVVTLGETITRVGHGNGAVPKDAAVVDLRPYTAIPGLIDLHTHITYYWDADSGSLPLRQPARDPSMTAELAFA